MRSRTIARWVAVFGAAAIAAGTVAAEAQTAPPTKQRRHTSRITVVPLSSYYRQCDFWLAVQHRPSGDVITPQQRCVWALR